MARNVVYDLYNDYVSMIPKLRLTSVEHSIPVQTSANQSSQTMDTLNSLTKLDFLSVENPVFEDSKQSENISFLHGDCENVIPQSPGYQSSPHPNNLTSFTDYMEAETSTQNRNLSISMPNLSQLIDLSTDDSLFAQNHVDTPQQPLDSETEPEISIEPPAETAVSPNDENTSICSSIEHTDEESFSSHEHTHDEPFSSVFNYSQHDPDIPQDWSCWEIWHYAATIENFKKTSYEMYKAIYEHMTCVKLEYTNWKCTINHY